MSKNIVETIDNLGTYRINEIFELLAPLLPISARKDGTVSINTAYQSQETIFFASAYGKQAENYQKEKTLFHLHSMQFRSKMRKKKSI